MTTQTKKVIIPDDMGATIEFGGAEPDKWNVAHDDTLVVKGGKLSVVPQENAGGLDCAAIGALPQKPWKKGTTVLARQDGNCVQMVASGDIFTDVVLELTSARNSITVRGENQEVANLVARVTNAGVNPASDIRLLIVKPQLGTYSMGTPALESRGATEFVKKSDLEYTIKTLASGGVATVTIPVTYSRAGAFTFGSQVTSTFDTNTTNNSKTVTISVDKQTTETGGNYEPTQDCPLFTITDDQYGVKLRTFAENEKHDITKGVVTGQLNIYADKKGLAGRSFTLTNAKQVLCFSGGFVIDSHGNQSTYSNASRTTFDYDYSNGSDKVRIVNHVGSNKSTNYSTSGSYSNGADLMVSHPASSVYKDGWVSVRSHTVLNDYTFDPTTGKLKFGQSFTKDLTKVHSATNVATLNIYVRPSESANCKWQVCVMKFTQELPATNKTNILWHESSLPTDKVSFDYDKSYSKFKHISPDVDKGALWVGGTLPSDLDAYLDASLKTVRDTGQTDVVITIKSGTTGTFKLKATDDRLASVVSQGGINTSYDAATKTCTVTLNKPIPQNSFKAVNVEFKVVD